MQLEIITHSPPNVSHPAPIWFIHGAWHAAWCWELFLPYFAQHGYQAHAVSLRGHGQSEGRERIRWWSAAHEYTADVAQVVSTLAAPPILIAHSMGGYVIQKYLETHSAAAGVLLAPIPVSGIAGFAMRHCVRHPWPLIKAHLCLNLWYLIETPALAQDAFFSSSMPAEEITRHFARLQPESFRTELETLFLDLPRPSRVKTPMLVLAAANDRLFSVAEEQATARAYRTEARVFPGMAHDMMLESGWQQVADHILEWLQEQNL